MFWTPTMPGNGASVRHQDRHLVQRRHGFSPSQLRAVVSFTPWGWLGEPAERRSRATDTPTAWTADEAAAAMAAPPMNIPAMPANASLRTIVLLGQAAS
jgi:hypothetical protein